MLLYGVTADAWAEARLPVGNRKENPRSTLLYISERREIDGFPVAEFGFPGDLRDRLVALILQGVKTAGAGLLAEYEEDGEPLPEPGDRFVLVDSSGRGVALIESVEVRVVRAGNVDEAFARDEGEGFETVADWRAAHERFWGGYRPEPITDDTLVVCDRFRLVEVFPEPR